MPRLWSVANSPGQTMPSVTVEVLALSLSAGGDLRCRAINQVLADDDVPDHVAAAAVGLVPGDEDVLLHSTSWRAVAAGVVLTYVVVPDPHPARSAQSIQGSPPMVSSGDPTRPSPRHVPIDAVLAHACRHLVFLHATDPQVTAIAVLRPTLWDALTQTAPALAGQLFADGHVYGHAGGV